MFIARIEIENFKSLKSVMVDLDPRVNVFAGVNGAGKSTLIGVVHLMFQRYISTMRSGRGAARGPMLREVRNGCDRVHLLVTAEDEDTIFTWRMDRVFKGLHSRTTDQDLDQLKAFIQRQETALEEPATANIPLIVTYPVGRAIIDIPLRVRTRDESTQAAAFQATALNQPRNFRSFFAWFREREDYENEQMRDNKAYQDPQLSAVRKAVERLMPGFADLRVMRKPLRMVVSKDGERLEIDDLSDGEKGLLALVGDLARRMSLANPGLEKPLEGRGIVLIDEIELHLHPAWQRHVVHGLLAAFPNVQFIFTTHSPQVISELRPEQTFLLKGGEAFNVDRSYGMESTQVLRELMGDPGRPQEVVDAIEKLYAELDEGDLEDGERQLVALESEVGDDPSLTLARARLRRGKVLRDREVHR
jgi:predicted ATP-binding protein involved in virulence